MSVPVRPVTQIPWLNSHPKSMLAAGVLTLGLLAGCGTAAGTKQAVSQAPAAALATGPINNPNLSQCGKDTRQIVDAFGSTVPIHGTPKRIVTIELSFTDDVSLLGVSPVGAGDDNDPNLIIPQIKSRIGPYVSIGTRESPNLAVIASLKPDLIIADRVGNKKIISQLRSTAPTLALWSQHADYRQNLDAATTIGVALNQCDTMKTVLATHDALMRKLKGEIPAGEHRSFVIGLSSAKTFTIFNDQQYNAQVLDLLGLKSIATDTRQFPAGDAQGVTLETLASLNPDVIFYANALDAPSTLLDTWKSSQVFKATAAAQSNRVYRVRQKPWSLTRGITGSEIIAAEAVHDLYGK